MKTRLFFLALPLCFCLGLVLTFGLAACDNGGGGKHEDSSSSGAVYNPSSANPEGDSIYISNFKLGEPVDGIITLAGMVNTKGSATRIRRLEFITQAGKTQPGWVSYDNSPVTGPIVNIEAKVINLNKAKIDLTNSAIGCGSHNITVKACPDATKEVGCQSDNGTFERPQSYCLPSSSSGAQSSSSEAVWKFDAVVSAELEKDEEKSMGTGASFKIIEYLVGTSTVTAVSITNGTIKELPNMPTTFDNSTDLGYPVADKEYPDGRKFIAEASTNICPSKDNSSNKPCIDITKEFYYLIYSSSGNDKYLIRFEPKSDWIEWPKVAKYWRVKVSP